MADKTGGYEKIYEDLLQGLGSVNLAKAAETLGLEVNQSGRVEISFLGRDYLLGPGEVLDNQGKKAPIIHGSLLAGYLLRQGRGEPSGRSVPMDKLTELVHSDRSYWNTSLEVRLAKIAQKNSAEFEEAIRSLGGEPGGEVGVGGKSWIIRLLPKIPAQVVLYEGDEEFPAVAHLMFDLTSVNFLEFEYLAVLATAFVDEVGRRSERGNFER